VAFLKRFTELRFMIGAFFTIIAIVLFANFFVMALNDFLSLYTASSFMLFGLLMMFAGKKKI
jgi:hypothetical protein